MVGRAEHGEEDITRITPARPAVSVSAEDILSKPLTKRQKADLARIAEQQAAGDDSRIDYSDIPKLTEEQLANAKRAPKRVR